MFTTSFRMEPLEDSRLRPEPLPRAPVKFGQNHLRGAATPRMTSNRMRPCPESRMTIRGCGSSDCPTNPGIHARSRKRESCRPQTGQKSPEKWGLPRLHPVLRSRILHGQFASVGSNCNRSPTPPVRPVYGSKNAKSKRETHRERAAGTSGGSCFSRHMICTVAPRAHEYRVMRIGKG